MKVYLIEDELPARQALIESLLLADPAIEVIGQAGSLHQCIVDMQKLHPDLIFMDIQLSDGNSFSIFERVEIKCPVIFITAFDQYLINAMQHNGIDYLLKPLKQEHLERSLQKYRQLQQHFNANIQQLVHNFLPSDNQLKRFVVKKGLDYFTIKTDEVAYFYTEHKVTFVVNFDRQKFIYDQPLTALENKLPDFFRLNRKYLGNIEAIKSYRPYAKGKLLIELNPQPEEEVIVSQEKSAEFKVWLQQ